MGDRTSVTLTVRKVNQQKTETAFENHYDADYAEDYEVQNKGHTGAGLILRAYQFDEINYGDLNARSKLGLLGIPYNSMWCSGDEYSSGTEYGRYTPNGDFIATTIYDSEQNIDPQRLLHIMANRNESELMKYYQIRELVSDHIATREAPSWENQDKYIKIYLTKKLIGAL